MVMKIKQVIDYWRRAAAEDLSAAEELYRVNKYHHCLFFLHLSNEITTFNISARYDDYKFKFYKKATREFTDKWLKIGKELHEEFNRILTDKI